MIEKPYWKCVQDNNNIIGKFGIITFICPECLNVYTARTKVESALYADPFKEGFSLSQPEVNFVCSHCHTKGIRIDNHLKEIIKSLLEKKYPVDLQKSCEGHIYVIDTILNYFFPIIIVKGCIKCFIPSNYYDKLLIKEEFNETIIRPNIEYKPDTFEKDKIEFIKIVKEMVKELPVLPVVCGFECR